MKMETLMQRPRLFIIALLIIAFYVAASAQDQSDFKMPSVTETAAAPEDFVPKGWRLLGKATGDLNDDGRADAVVVAAHDAESGEPTDVWEEPRLLIIALGEGGRLRLSAVSADVVLCRGCGGVFGDPFEGVLVERGAVVVMHYSGSRNRWAYTDRFRLQDKQWTHIGATEAHMDTLDPSYDERRDVNLSTGLVIETGHKGRRSYKREYYEVRAARIERAPVLDGAISETEWPGVVVRVASKENVVQGTGAWSGAEDLSARVGALWKGDELFVRAEVTDDSVTEGDGLRLVTKGGQVVKPLETRRTAREKGYAVEARYSLKSLGIEEIEARIKELRGYGASERDIPEDRSLRVAVEIVDEDAAQKIPSVLSTSRGGRKYPARIRLTRRAGVPLLSDFDRDASGDVLPFTTLYGDEPR